jgi:hypothetical protein
LVESLGIVDSETDDLLVFEVHVGDAFEVVFLPAAKARL